MPSPRLLALVVLVTPLLACGAKHAWSHSDGRRLDLEGELTVAPAIALWAVPGVVERDPFVDGLFIGHLHMSGGYVVVETERGMQHRSRSIEPSAQEEYTEEALAWLDSAIEQALSARRVEARRIEPLPPSAIQPPRRIMLRGTGEDDGRDNQNLPRFNLTPGSLRTKEISSTQSESGLVLLPLLVHYYSHNGGWFMGQTYGTTGGARLRALWVVYDAGSGEPLRWGEVSARALAAGMSPSRAETEDRLLEAEARALRVLKQSLLD